MYDQTLLRYCLCATGPKHVVQYSIDRFSNLAATLVQPIVAPSIIEPVTSNEAAPLEVTLPAAEAVSQTISTEDVPAVIQSASEVKPHAASPVTAADVQVVYALTDIHAISHNNVTQSSACRRHSNFRPRSSRHSYLVASWIWTVC